MASELGDQKGACPPLSNRLLALGRFVDDLPLDQGVVHLAR